MFNGPIYIFINCTIHIKNKPDLQVKGRRHKRYTDGSPTVAHGFGEDATDQLFCILVT